MSKCLADTVYVTSFCSLPLPDLFWAVFLCIWQIAWKWDGMSLSTLTLTLTYHLNHKEVISWFEHTWRAWKSTETPWQMSTLPATSYVKRNRHQWQKLILVFSGERDVKTGLTKGPSCSLVLTVWTEIYTWVSCRRSLCWVLAVPFLILFTQRSRY